MQVTKPASKRKHHTSICPGKHQESTDQMNNPLVNNPLTTKHLTTNLHAYPPFTPVTIPDSGTQINVNVMNTACLLKTAIVPVQAPNFTTQANILFDERTQRSYVTRKLAIDN